MKKYSGSITVKIDSIQITVNGGTFTGDQSHFQSNVENQLADLIQNNLAPRSPTKWYETWWGILALAVAAAGIIYWLGWT